MATRRAAYFSPFIILVHSHLGLEWGATAAERFDDAVEGAENEGEDGPQPEWLFNPRQANTILCDEDPTGSLVEETRLSADDIGGLGRDGLGDKILAGLGQPSGLLTYLRSERISPERLREAAQEARRAERSRGQISSPEAGDGDVAQAARSAPRVVRLSRVLERLADELASGR